MGVKISTPLRQHSLKMLLKPIALSGLLYGLVAGSTISSRVTYEYGRAWYGPTPNDEDVGAQVIFMDLYAVGIDGGIYHLSTNGVGHIAVKEMYDKDDNGDLTRWNRLAAPPIMKQVSARGKMLVGVDTSNDIYYRYDDTTAWEQIEQGKASHCSFAREGFTAPSDIVCLQDWKETKNIYYLESVDGQFVRINSDRLTQLDIEYNGSARRPGHTKIWGVNREDLVFTKDGVHGSWYRDANLGVARWISVSPDKTGVWSVNGNNEGKLMRWDKSDSTWVHQDLSSYNKSKFTTVGACSFNRAFMTASDGTVWYVYAGIRAGIQKGGVGFDSIEDKFDKEGNLIFHDLIEIPIVYNIHINSVVCGG